MEYFQIIWPERRRVSNQEIALWFSDAVANGELSAECASDPMFAGEDRHIHMARELHSLGNITLAE